MSLPIRPTEENELVEQHPEVSGGPVPRRLRWRSAVVIVLLGLVAMLAAWFGLHDRTYQVFALWILVPATLFGLVLWWLFASGIAWWARVIGLVLAATVASTLRVDDYKGDMFPVIRFRWQPDREKVTQDYFAGIGTSGIAAVQETLEAADGDWTGFRGPQRDGVVTGLQLAIDWASRPPRELWRHPVGQGWSSFAVVGKRAFTQEQRGGIEVVSCWDITSGEQLWVNETRERFSEAMGGLGPRATPTFHESRIFALGATGQLHCLDAASGRRHWTVDILENTTAKNLEWAMTGSPLVYGNTVVVIAGGSQGGVVAFDVETGKQAWASGSRPASYASPRLVEFDGAATILAFGGDGLSAYGAVAGKEFWHFPWTNGPRVNAAMPVLVAPRRLFISSGYGQGCAVLELADTGPPTELWRSRQMKCKFNDPVVHDGFVYGLDEGILVCLDLETGQRRWKRGRYGYGQLLLVGDKILVQAERGYLALVDASPERFRELGRFDALTEKTWNHPVLVAGGLLVRNASEMACFELPLAH